MKYKIKFSPRHGWFVFRNDVNDCCYLHMDLTWGIFTRKTVASRFESYFATIEIAKAALAEALGVESLEAIDVEY